MATEKKNLSVPEEQVGIAEDEEKSASKRSAAKKAACKSAAENETDSNRIDAATDNAGEKPVAKKTAAVKAEKSTVGKAGKAVAETADEAKPRKKAAASKTAVFEDVESAGRVPDEAASDDISKHAAAKSKAAAKPASEKAAKPVSQEADSQQAFEEKIDTQPKQIAPDGEFTAQPITKPAKKTKVAIQPAETIDISESTMETEIITQPTAQPAPKAKVAAPAPETETAGQTALETEAAIPEAEIAGQTAPEAKTAASVPEPDIAVRHAAGQSASESEAAARPVAEPDDEEPVKNGQLNFDEEEVALAASDPDLDMGDETEEEGDQSRSEELVSSLEHISKMNKRELVDFFSSLLDSKPVQQVRREAEAIKVAFYKLHRAEYEQSKKQFEESGGDPEQFIPAVDNEEIRLKELFAVYRHRRADYIAELEKKKENNLKIKLEIIEELKELVNSHETLNNTFNSFRELQQRWREVGVVPQTSVKELWETYNLHVENFYNYIKINKELRDLDLKRNYETKIQLCEAAEALVLEPSVVGAFRKLQELHDRWRETGPVANEYKEALWERFKEASSRINRQHQEHFEGLKEEQKRNLDLKVELCVKSEELSREILTTRKEWNRASDRLIEIQKVWKTIGFAPQKENTRIYERFRRACDRFFELKRNFYDQAKVEMENNLQLKTEICIEAESLKESDQWKKTSDDLIALQKRWKEIGPVSRRHSDAVWKRFRAACDYFFERKASHFSGVDARQDDNLQKKLAMLDEMAAADISGGGFEMIKEFQRRWNELGFVPIKQKNEIQRRYKAVVDGMFSQLRSGERGRNMDRFRDRVNSMAGSGDRRLKFERDKLYNKVKQLEADVTLLENNIGFFSKSKNAEAMIKDVQEKIERAKREIVETVEKINLIDSQQH